MKSSNKKFSFGYLINRTSKAKQSYHWSFPLSLYQLTFAFGWSLSPLFPQVVLCPSGTNFSSTSLLFLFCSLQTSIISCLCLLFLAICPSGTNTRCLENVVLGCLMPILILSILKTSIYVIFFENFISNWWFLEVQPFLKHFL